MTFKEMNLTQEQRIPGINPQEPGVLQSWFDNQGPIIQFWSAIMLMNLLLVMMSF